MTSEPGYFKDLIKYDKVPRSIQEALKLKVLADVNGVSLLDLLSSDKFVVDLLESLTVMNNKK